MTDRGLLVRDSQGRYSVPTDGPAASAPSASPIWVKAPCKSPPSPTTWLWGCFHSAASIAAALRSRRGLPSTDIELGAGRLPAGYRISPSPNPLRLPPDRRRVRSPLT